MDAWSGLYSVTAAAAATLMGLLFVAVSLNGAEVFGDGRERQKSLAEQSFRNYIAVLTVSLIALFPKTDIRDFSAVALGVAMISAAIVASHLLRLLRSWRHDAAHWLALRRHAVSLLAFSALAYGGVKRPDMPGDSRVLFAVATILLLVSTTIVSWELLQAMAMIPRSPRD